MNIQIFGTPKSFDTKKAQRYFSDRRIRVQFVDLREKSLSRGEFNSVRTAVGGADALLRDPDKNENLFALLRYLGEEAKCDKIFENQSLLRLPIVRNGKQATVGYRPEIWKDWE